MKITRHGTWTPYKPKALPEGAPPTALFCESDGVDWYEYMKHFTDADSVLMTLSPLADGEHLVQAVRRGNEADFLFPQNSLLLEVHGYTGDDPFKEFNGRIFDGRTITDRRPPPRNPWQEIDDLRERIARIEERIK